MTTTSTSDRATTSPWQKDNKVCFLRMEGKLFGDVPMNIELRLSVEDSPNSAGVAIDMVRCAKLALERGQGGVLDGPAAYFCKHPPRQYTDDQAHQMTEAFIAGAPFSVTVEREVRPTPAAADAERKRGWSERIGVAYSFACDDDRSAPAPDSLRSCVIGSAGSSACASDSNGIHGVVRCSDVVVAVTSTTRGSRKPTLSTQRSSVSRIRNLPDVAHARVAIRRDQQPTWSRRRRSTFRAPVRRLGAVVRATRAGARADRGGGRARPSKTPCRTRRSPVGQRLRAAPATPR